MTFDDINHLTNAYMILYDLKNFALIAQEVWRRSLDDHLASVLITTA
jgi:hypothetical protein